MNTKYDFPINKLTVLLFDLNRLVDSGVHVQCSYDDMMKNMKSGTVLQYLQGKFPEETGWSLSWATTDDQSNFTQYFNRSLITFSDVIDPRRKMAIEYNGITLLIGFIIELIQEGKWEPNLDIGGLDD